jgi:hypothetical protein
LLPRLQRDAEIGHVRWHTGDGSAEVADAAFTITIEVSDEYGNALMLYRQRSIASQVG